ncbi:AFP-like protein 2 [Senna tora]|uniref:Ninja-family protein n=1 Tax=Senna tora TaxID=362788 RepID=A0A834TQH3_9FABA|nr:AFP-like protein 2 [Senna tora]
MVQVSEIGLKKEDEVELDLGLSIGGSFHRRISDKPKPTSSQPDPKPTNAFQFHHLHQPWELGSFKDAKPENRTCSTSMAVAVMDPQTKREIHALRRLEAKKKLEEKQQQKRVLRESEQHQQRPSKRERTDPHGGGDGGGGGGSEEWRNVNLNLNGSATVSFHQPYAFVQVNNNGYAYPCVVPLMAPCVEQQKNAGGPAACGKGFRPFLGNGYGSEPNGERDCGGDNNKKATKSDGSSMCSSSVVSDYQSSSHEGGGSSESQSHSVHSKENNDTMRSQAEQSASSSHSMRSDHVNGQTSSVSQPHDHQTKPNQSEQQSTLLMDHNNAASPVIQADNKRKPPKPLPPPPPPAAAPTSSTLPAALPKMPYVSTTGDGPNGKRVEGFLYRYSNSEVSIVCVCHGSTFSPAGFVQHAGGTDTSHPERNITVIPSAFG